MLMKPFLTPRGSFYMQSCSPTNEVTMFPFMIHCHSRNVFEHNIPIAAGKLHITKPQHFEKEANWAQYATQITMKGLNELSFRLPDQNIGNTERECERERRIGEGERKAGRTKMKGRRENEKARKKEREKETKKKKLTKKRQKLRWNLAG